MAEIVMLLPPLEPYPPAFMIHPTNPIDWRLSTYFHAFLSEYQRWLAETDMAPEDMELSVEGMEGAIRGLHALHKESAGKSGPRSLGEILDGIMPQILGTNPDQETRQ